MLKIDRTHISHVDRKVIDLANNTNVPYNDEMTINEMLEFVIQANANKCSIYCNKYYTYADLARRINEITSGLISHRVSTGDTVALFCGRGFDVVAAFFAIINYGCICMPIHADDIEENINTFISDGKASAVIMDKNYNIAFDAKLKIKTIYTTECQGQFTEINVQNSRSNAILLYSSGTTNKPKGVYISHRLITNYVIYDRAFINTNTKTRWAHFSPLCCLSGVLEMCGVLLNGGCLFELPKSIISDPSLFSKFIYDYKITHCFMTPGYALKIQPSKFLQVLQVGGARFENEILNRFKTTPIVSNGYGLTEGGVPLVWKKENYKSKFSLGKPINNTQVYVISNNKECGIEEPGELCVAGYSLSNGYVNSAYRPDAFVANPFGNDKLLFTGDKAQWNPHGEIEYLGRLVDCLDGSDLTLQELEEEIKSCNGIRDVALLKDDEKQYLELYYIPNHRSTLIGFEDYAKLLLNAHGLGEWLVSVKKIAKFPLNRNGKIDKLKLKYIKE